MGFGLTSPAPKKCDLTAKNRFWGFFGDGAQTSRESGPQTLQPRQRNPPIATKPASGRAFWPSRDPIGERGGINLYGMVGNEPIDLYDFLGLDPEGKKGESNTPVINLPENPDTKKVYTKYLFIGKDQRTPDETIYNPDGSLSLYVPPEVTAMQTKQIKELKSAASGAGYKVIDEVDVISLRNAWSHPMVTEVFLYTHGLEKGEGLECTYLKKGGILAKAKGVKYQRLIKNVKLPAIFDPELGSGKTFAVLFCCPHRNFTSHIERYTKSGVKANDLYNGYFNEKNDRPTDRGKNKDRLIKYFKSQITK